MALRDYQQNAVDAIRSNYGRGIKRVLLHLATGAGKTVVFSHVLTSTAYNSHRCIMVVRGRKLVDQASSRLFREGVHHGVLMANHWNYRPNAPIQICSIDTLISKKLRPEAKLIVIDEAHMAASEGYMKFLSQYPDAYILAVTATPYTDKSLRHIADEIVKPIAMRELIAQGYLVDARYFAPSSPDLSGVKVSSATKDYVQEELARAMQKGTLTGDIVHHWIKLGEQRPTLCFAATVGHSKNIVEQFRMAGITAEHCDADTPEPERERIIKRVESGATKVVSNVGIFCTGVDIPAISCIVFARPTKSYNLYVQQAGRGTRPAPDKKDFLVLDHAGNVHRHGFVTDEREANLDGKVPSGKKSPHTCPSCYAVFYGFNCPLCGFVTKQVEAQPREIVVTDGTLEEIKRTPFEAQVARDIYLLEQTRKLRGYKKGWIHFKLLEIHGKEIADKFYPRPYVPQWLDRGAHEASERHSGSPFSEPEHKMLEIPESDIAS